MEGGSHYNPVLVKDHLEWAMTSLHEMHEDQGDVGHRTCWFGGVAYMVVRNRKVVGVIDVMIKYRLHI